MGAQRTPDFEPSWMAVMGDVFDEAWMHQLRAFLVDEKRRGETIYPPGKDIFNAFRYTPFDKVKVVILGQDPYHGAGQAHGLCFSVQPGVAAPPSLQNIFKELQADLGCPRPDHGCLVHWARQGVLLLNDVLTVRAGQPQSHAGRGWEQFTARAIAELNRRREHLVFLLWGRNAQVKAGQVDRHRHLVLTAPHPSPLSAHSGFLGCRHFSKANRYLSDHGEAPVEWSLPNLQTPFG